MGGIESANSRTGPPDAAASRLVPVVARVIELGRGPPALVRWVRNRVAALGGPPGPDPARGPAVLLRVAGELARLLPGPGPWETLDGRAQLTLRGTHPGLPETRGM